MGYVVFHLDKSPGNESAMTDHIERKVIHPNVDPERVHLNKELVEFPDGIKNRTEAIQHRLDTAGLKRQIGKNQVKVIRVMISGSPEDMKRIENENRLDDWCRDNMDYLKKTFGEKNLVAATLHMDETTPHIHASIVPIVRGERRQKKPKKKPEEDNQAQKPNEGQKPKRTYKKKGPNMPRLCVDDVMAREKLIEYQDTYAAAMAKYGLKRGIKGSDARHITLTEHYRNQTIESNNLQINIEQLLVVEEAKRQRIEELKQKEQKAKLKSIQAEEQKQQKEFELKKTEESLNQAKGQLKTEELKNKAADVGSNIIDGISSFVGTSKVKRQQQEIESLKHEKYELQQDIDGLTQTISRERSGRQQETMQLKAEIHKIHDWLPDTPTLIKWGEYCQKMGFSNTQAKDLINMRPVRFSGELYSTEYSQRFAVNDAEMRLDRGTGKLNGFRLLLNGVSLTQWFRQKYDEFRETLGIKPNQKQEVGKNKGFKI
ncbi:plasmid recombination protein [Parabacteroides sp. OttesenSCG-928-G07]|nr:plasmid recombination protein [Parabacteroides sp. OttesenSCG-928-G07]